MTASALRLASLSGKPASHGVTVRVLSLRRTEDDNRAVTVTLLRPAGGYNSESSRGRSGGPTWPGRTRLKSESLRAYE